MVRCLSGMLSVAVAYEATAGCDADTSALMQKRVAKNMNLHGDGAASFDDPGAVLSGGYCDADGLAIMHGRREGENTANPSGELQKNILKDVQSELEDNNVDADVNDLFSFYVCTRWVPDEVFWDIAEHEMQSEILKSVVNKEESAQQAVAELYQNFKFVPMLCSKNIQVFGETHPTTKTHFPKFKEEVESLATFFEGAKDKDVHKALVEADQIFCKSNKMNSASCNLKFSMKSYLKKAKLPKWLTGNVETRSDRWEQLETYFNSFQHRNGTTEEELVWNEDFDAWKARMPYHSFIAKQNGIAEDVSPIDKERFMICFGKRVASELHRRPGGNHILTDQNNLGCHGWWDVDQAAQMLRRIVDLWKPPTCQLAEMKYKMKRQILDMYVRMNEELFDALPTMLNDETLSEEELALSFDPAPFNISSVVREGVTYYEGMRIAAVKGVPSIQSAKCAWWRSWNCKKTYITHGSAGTVGDIADGTLRVLWDKDKYNKYRSVKSGVVQIVAPEYGYAKEGILDKVKSLGKAAWGKTTDFFSGRLSQQYAHMGAFMSGSFAKWIMCPIVEDANMEELDQLLGTEDPVLREHVKEAYSKWTGYEGEVPGDKCTSDADLLPEAQFQAGCRVCEFSELWVSEPEKWWTDDTYQTEEEFMCPKKPMMTPREQLAVFMEKPGMCMMHMTENHKRDAQWTYRGDSPGRRQHDVKSNPPVSDYELVKVLEMQDSNSPEQVSYGRSCSSNEWKDNARFCEPPTLVNPWSSMSAMASYVSRWLQGSPALPPAAVESLNKNYQSFMKATNLDAVDQGISDAADKAEKARDALFSLGRYAHTVVKTAKGENYDLPSHEMRHARLEEELFGFAPGGDFMHSASFQRKIEGDVQRTSNDGDVFSRYAVVCPCAGMDPAMELALRWQWQETALRILREGHRAFPDVLDQPSPTLEARAEARLFVKPGKDGKNQSYYQFDAAVRQDTADASFVTAYDQKLAAAIGGEDPSEMDRLAEATVDSAGGNSGDDIGVLRSLKVTFTCGPKSAYSSTGGPTVTGSATLKECLVEGARQNAAAKAREPMTLYFPEEVVVVAEFGTSETAACSVPPDHENWSSKLCSGARADTPGLDAHLSEQKKTSKGATYAGMTTGKGWPSGAVREVHMRPEDLLQVTGMLLPPKSR